MSEPGIEIQLYLAWSGIVIILEDSILYQQIDQDILGSNLWRSKFEICQDNKSSLSGVRYRLIEGLQFLIQSMCRVFYNQFVRHFFFTYCYKWQMKVNPNFEIITSVILELWAEILWEKNCCFRSITWNIMLIKTWLALTEMDFLVTIHQYIDYNKPNEIYVCMGVGGHHCLIDTYYDLLCVHFVGTWNGQSFSLAYQVYSTGISYQLLWTIKILISMLLSSVLLVNKWTQFWKLEFLILLPRIKLWNLFLHPAVILVHFTWNVICIWWRWFLGVSVELPVSIMYQSPER